jgi:hypothetical protein
MKRTIIIAGLALALLAPATTAIAEEVTAPTMTTEQAGARYMSYVCPANAAGARYNRAVDRYDAHDHYGNRPHKKTRAAAKKYATKARSAARAFVDPAFPWPVDIADDVQGIAVAYYEHAANAKAISKKRYRWDDLYWADTQTEVATVRLFLGLPPAPDGC